MTKHFKYFIGIDVSKDKIDIYSTETSSHFTVNNSSKSIRKALYHGFSKDETLVILEATGGYEMVCINVLIELGFKVHRANNNKVKKYKDFSGLKAKTDKIDAKALAYYGITAQNNPLIGFKLTLYKPITKANETLCQISRCLRTITKLRTAIKNISSSPGGSNIKDSCQRLIDCFNQEIKILEKKIENMIKENKELYAKYKLLQAYKGVGKVTALELLTELPELGTLDKRKISSLAGLAPKVNDSGKFSGYRSTKGNGRTSFKALLFMPVSSAIQHNQELKAFFDKKVDEGKPKMVAIIACMRKMIIHLNAIVARGSFLY